MVCLPWYNVQNPQVAVLDYVCLGVDLVSD
jgi:hypothetical protein